MNAQNKNLCRCLALAEEMLALADDGDDERSDVGCGVLYGLVRDHAYKIRSLTREEITQHEREGRWDGPSSRKLLQYVSPHTRKQHV